MKLYIALLFFAVALASAKQWKTLRPLKDPLTPPPPAPSERIVGGHETIPHAYPHQVALHIGGMYFCGGTLISENIVLTAAHCVDGLSYAEVIAGAHDLTKDEPSQQIINSYELFAHEEYDSFRIVNDIAYIRTSKPFTFNEYVTSVCYNGNDTYPPVGSIVTPTGWGVYNDSEDTLSDVLEEVNVPVMSNEDCDRVYGDIYAGEICIDSTGGRGTCSGDSGGPLNYEGKTVGITSFGSSTGCETGYPDAFTRTSTFSIWIITHTAILPCPAN